MSSRADSILKNKNIFFKVFCSLSIVVISHPYNKIIKTQMEPCRKCLKTNHHKRDLIIASIYIEAQLSLTLHVWRTIGSSSWMWKITLGKVVWICTYPEGYECYKSSPRVIHHRIWKTNTCSTKDSSCIDPNLVKMPKASNDAARILTFLLNWWDNPTVKYKSFPHGSAIMVGQSIQITCSHGHDSYNL